MSNILHVFHPHPLLTNIMIFSIVKTNIDTFGHMSCDILPSSLNVLYNMSLFMVTYGKGGGSYVHEHGHSCIWHVSIGMGIWLHGYIGLYCGHMGY
jgi:hypothetical protein